MREAKTFKKEQVSVSFMVDQLRETVGVDIQPVNEVSGQKRVVTESNLHRPGLALAGYTKLFTHQRVQILGNTENQYLGNLNEDERRNAMLNVLDFDVPCIVLTDSNELTTSLLNMATEREVPVYSTPLPSTEFMGRLREFLSDQFAIQQSMHGALVDVYGVGLLLEGAAGIGKSEMALDLVERGHRLVADDVVIVSKKEGGIVMGSGTDLVQHFMEIRGLGLVDVRAMFGVRAIRSQKRVEVVVHMHLWDKDEEYTRLAMVEDTRNILGVELPMVKLPITPGKNITVLCEVIAMTHLLKREGYDPAEVFAKRLSDRIKDKNISGPLRGVDYFEGDYE